MSKASFGRPAGAGVKLIHEKPFDGAGGKLVAFLHPKSTFGVLTEFCMPKPGLTPPTILYDTIKQYWKNWKNGAPPPGRRRRGQTGGPPQERA